MHTYVHLHLPLNNDVPSMVFDKIFSLNQFGSGHAMGDRLEPIMLLKFPIMLLSNAPLMFLLCLNYAPFLCYLNPFQSSQENQTL